MTAQWRVETETMPDRDSPTTRYRFVTLRGRFEHGCPGQRAHGWVKEHLIKEKSDIDLLGEFMTAPKCDTAAVNVAADGYGERGIGAAGTFAVSTSSGNRAAGRTPPAW